MLPLLPGCCCFVTLSAAPAHQRTSALITAALAAITACLHFRFRPCWPSAIRPAQLGLRCCCCFPVEAATRPLLRTRPPPPLQLLALYPSKHGLRRCCSPSHCRLDCWCWCAASPTPDAGRADDETDLISRSGPWGTMYQGWNKYE